MVISIDSRKWWSRTLLVLPTQSDRRNLANSVKIITLENKESFPPKCFCLILLTQWNCQLLNEIIPISLYLCGVVPEGPIRIVAVFAHRYIGILNNTKVNCIFILAKNESICVGGTRWDIFLGWTENIIIFLTEDMLLPVSYFTEFQPSVGWYTMFFVIIYTFVMGFDQKVPLYTKFSI